MKPRQCGNCGNKTMSLQKVAGPFPWKDFPAVQLVAAIELLKCSSCGETGLRPNDSDRIDRAVEASIRVISRVLVDSILSREACSQIALAARIGVTPEYLSGIKNGLRTPGFQTFNMLKILAEGHDAFLAADPLFQLEEFSSQASIEDYEEALKKLA